MENRAHLVLCVDDEVVGLRVRKILLERAGYQVLTAHDGKSGLEIFSAQPVEAVIVDCAMPGMHGGDVAWQLASHPLLRAVRVIVSSAHSADEIRRKLPPAKIPILPKPIDFDALLRLIEDESSDESGRVTHPV